MVPQVEKEAAAPLKAKATVKALKPTKQCSKASTATKKKKEDLDITHILTAQNTMTQGSPNKLRRAPLTETSLTTMPSSSPASPLSQR